MEWGCLIQYRYDVFLFAVLDNSRNGKWEADEVPSSGQSTPAGTYTACLYVHQMERGGLGFKLIEWGILQLLDSSCRPPTSHFMNCTSSLGPKP